MLTVLLVALSIFTIKYYNEDYGMVEECVTSNAAGCVANGSIDVITVEGKKNYADAFCPNPEDVQAEGCMTEVSINETKLEVEED